MKTTLTYTFALLLVLSLAGFAPQQEKVKVSGTVMHTGVFCGGTRMPDEMLAKIAEPKPLPLKKLYVKKGKRNDFSQAPVLTFTSDSAGNFSIELPPGEYCIVDAFKKDKSNYDDILKKYAKETKYYSAVDKSCLASWFETPDAILTVGASGSITNFVITYADKCSWNSIPCVQYRGPLPP